MKQNKQLENVRPTITIIRAVIYKKRAMKRELAVEILAKVLSTIAFRMHITIQAKPWKTMMRALKLGKLQLTLCTTVKVHMKLHAQ